MTSDMRAYLICLLLTVLPVWAQASTIQLQVRPGINASAEYIDGQHDKPAVLLLHGFLQTRDFPTVATLARGLRDEGYPVLSPTLSLSIPNRSKSLACEAVHRHSMEDDVAEIARWVKWLKTRGHRSVVLVGHSYGSLQLLAYLDGKPDRIVKGFIGASLIEARIGNITHAALLAKLDAQARNSQHPLANQTLSFCKKYLSAPDALASYVRWDQPRTLAALKKSPVSVKLIMGEADEMVAKNWIKTLEQSKTPMVVIKGASHFMDGEHEFDLLENTLNFLTDNTQSASR